MTGKWEKVVPSDYFFPFPVTRDYFFPFPVTRDNFFPFPVLKNGGKIFQGDEKKRENEEGILYIGKEITVKRK